MSVASTRRRVAVTGVGMVTPVGNDVATTWDALLAGRSGGAPITLFDASGFSTHIAAEVKGFRNVLVDAQIGLALALAAESGRWPAHTPLVAARMTNVKVRAFTPPGQVLTLTATLKPQSGRTATVQMGAQAEGRVVATARLEIAESTAHAEAA